MKRITPLALAVTITLLLAACHSTEKDNTPDFLTANIDTTADPGRDFFQYANGGWIKRTPIPEAESMWGIGQLIREDKYARLRSISEKAATEKAAPGTVSQQIGDLWASGMDSADIERQGITPLKPDLEKIASIVTIRDLVNISADFHRKSSGVLFTETVAQDDKESDVMAYQLIQGGLGLPNRDFYFNKAVKTAVARDAYRQFMFRVFVRLGNDSAAALQAANTVFALETRLAKASRRLEEMRDPNRNYNKLTRSELQKLTPSFSWDDWFMHTGIKKIDSVIVRQPEFFTALESELKTTSIADWKLYLQAHLVMDASPYLDSRSFADFFEFDKTLSGAKTPQPRWKRVLASEEGAMGEALGQLFVKEYFPEQAKERYSNLVEAIRDAYKDRIKNLTWMSDSTKQRALYKLSRITKKVGYPDKWKDFSAMKIDRGPWILNMQRASEWWVSYYINKLGKPVDRTEWDMPPQTYNAEYNPGNNEMILPAGIFLVPGKKDSELDDAFVYGYAGASTIGHEMTHGFDDQGRQYDADGNLHEWWQSEDSAKFVARASAIIRQFNEFSPVDTLHVNGDATQGENIADLGGLLLGLDAFKKTEVYRKGEKIGGLTPIQRYFFGYTYSWMSQEQKELLVTQLLTDVHAPSRERVNGPMANIPEFREAFGIKPGSPMIRPDSLRVSIW